MNKKGFTLIELLAVIVILSIILLIAVPIVLRIINDSKAESARDSVELYGRSIEQAIANYYMKNPEKETVTLQELKDGEYLQYKGTAPECNETIVRNKKVYLGGCKVGKINIDTTYGEYIPQPDLDNGLTPVVYRNNNWVVVDSTDDEWYDYEEQKWANAVVLRNDVTKEKGDIVSVEGSNPEALMMLVWIPRYEYKYTNLGEEYAGGTQDQPGGIDINFISKSITKESSNEYKIHPAFTFGTEEESGFWVGKFELSSVGSNLTTANNLRCNGSTCAENAISNLRILPNVSSLRYNNVSNFFYAIRGIETTFGLSNIDTHMMKNSEWGAVAYLSQSRYGKYGNPDYEGVQKEVYINNSVYITGRSGGNPGGNTKKKDTYPGQTSEDQYNDYGYYTYDGYLLNYNTNTKSSTRDINKGTGASTTGNIYGVYDMSGGTWEYVMGAYGDSDGIYSSYSVSLNSGFTGKNGTGDPTEGAPVPEPKYYDIYTTSDATTACGGGVCYGHALSETSGWYGDYYDMLTSDLPWLVRGGHLYSKARAGFFYCANRSGSDNNLFSTRVVGIRK